MHNKIFKYVINKPFVTQYKKHGVSGNISSPTDSQKTVIAYDRKNGLFLASTVRELDGSFELFLPFREDEQLMLICRDEGGDYNADIYDRISLCITEHAPTEGDIFYLREFESKLLESTEQVAYTNGFITIPFSYINENIRGDIVSAIVSPLEFKDINGDPVENSAVTDSAIINGHPVIIKDGGDTILRNARKDIYVEPDIFGDGSNVLTVPFNGNGVPSESDRQLIMPPVRYCYSPTGSLGTRILYTDAANMIPTYRNQLTWNSPYSISFWLNWEYMSSNSSAYILHQPGIFRIDAYYSGVLYFYTASSITAWNATKTISLPNMKYNWKHYVITFNDGYFKLYENGVLMTTQAIANVSGNFTGNEFLFVGARSSYNNTLSMSMLRMFNKIITQNEVDILFAERIGNEIDNIEEINGTTFENYKLSIAGTGLIKSSFINIPFDESIADTTDRGILMTVNGITLKGDSIAFDGTSNIHKAETSDDSSGNFTHGSEDDIDVGCIFLCNDTGIDSVIWKSGDSENGLAVGIKNGEIGLFGSDNSVQTSITIPVKSMSVNWNRLLCSKTMVILLDDETGDIIDSNTGVVSAGIATAQESVGGANGGSPMTSGSSGSLEFFDGEISNVITFEGDTSSIETRSFLKIAAEVGETGVECEAYVEKWDAANEECIIWVKIPELLSTADNTIRLYFDKGHADNIENVSLIDVEPETPPGASQDWIDLKADAKNDSIIEYITQQDSECELYGWNSSRKFRITINNDYKEQTDFPITVNIPLTDAIVDEITDKRSNGIGFETNQYFTVTGNSILSLTSSWRSCLSYSKKSRGKFVARIKKVSGTNQQTFIGITKNPTLDYFVGQLAGSIGVQGDTTGYYKDGTYIDGLFSYGDGDVIDTAIDFDNGKLWFAKNGTWYGDPELAIGGISFDNNNRYYFGVTSYAAGITFEAQIVPDIDLPNGFSNWSLYEINEEFVAFQLANNSSKLYAEIDGIDQSGKVYQHISSLNSVRPTSSFNSTYYGHFAMNRLLPLSGSITSNSWLAANGNHTNQKFNINYGRKILLTSFVIYNMHNNFSTSKYRNCGIKDFEIYGTNSYDAFKTTTYADDTDLTLLGTFQAKRHALIEDDPQVFNIPDNTVKYKFYVLKISSDWTGTYGVDGEAMGFRRFYAITDSNTLKAYVKLPILKTGQNVINFYYDKDNTDNDSLCGQIGSDTAKNVWSNNYLFVYHMNDNFMNRKLIDSVGSYDLDVVTKFYLENNNTSDQSSINFAGGNYYYQGAEEIIFDKNNFTLEALLTAQNAVADYFSIGTANYKAIAFAVGTKYSVVSSSNGSLWTTLGGLQITSDDSYFSYFACKRTSNKWFTYVNDITTPGSITDGAPLLNNNIIKIGAHYSLNGTYFYQNRLGELRMSTVERSDSWLQSTMDFEQENVNIDYEFIVTNLSVKQIIPIDNGYVGTKESLEDIPTPIILNESNIPEGIFSELFSACDNSTVLMLQSDYQDGERHIVDYSNYKHIVYSSGNVKHSTNKQLFNKSSIFIDTDGEIIVNHHNDFVFGSDPFTIEFFFWNESNGVYANLISKTNGPSTYAGWYIMKGTDGKLYFETNNNSQYALATNACPILSWVHVVVSFNGVNTKLYMNGSLEANITTITSIQDVGTPIRIGYMADSYKYSGYMNNIRIDKGIDRYDGISSFSIPTDLYPSSLKKEKCIFVSDRIGNGIYCDVETIAKTSLASHISNANSVKATTTFSTSHYPHFATNYLLSLTGSWSNTSWISANGTITNQKFNIDMCSKIVLKTIELENGHSSGSYTYCGIGTFSVYGTNSESAFLNTIYADDTDLTFIETFIARAHIASDSADKQTFEITNNIEKFRYYVIKIVDRCSTGVEQYMSIRSIRLYDTEQIFIKMNALSTMSNTNDNIINVKYITGSENQFIGFTGSYSAAEVWKNGYTAVFNFGGNILDATMNNIAKLYTTTYTLIAVPFNPSQIGYYAVMNGSNYIKCASTTVNDGTITWDCSYKNIFGLTSGWGGIVQKYVDQNNRVGLYCYNGEGFPQLIADGVEFKPSYDQYEIGNRFVSIHNENSAQKSYRDGIFGYEDTKVINTVEGDSGILALFTYFYANNITPNNTTGEVKNIRLANINRSKYWQYVSGIIEADNLPQYEESLGEETVTLPSWENAHIVSAKIAQTYVPSDMIDFMMPFYLKRSSGINMYDFKELFDQMMYSSYFDGIVIKDCKFGGNNNGMCGFNNDDIIFSSDRDLNQRSAVKFDGTADKVIEMTKFNRFLFGGEFTFCGWFKFGKEHIANTYRSVLGTNYYEEFTISTYGGNIDIWFGQNTSYRTNLRFNIGEAFIADGWIHLAVVLNPTLASKTYYLYANGNLIRTSTYSYSPTGGYNTFYFGSNLHYPTNKFIGEMDSITMFSKCLTDEEIKKLYNGSSLRSYVNNYVTSIFNIDETTFHPLRGESLDNIIIVSEECSQKIAYSLEILQNTFSIVDIDGNWRHILTSDDSIHGDTGNSNWFYRTNAGDWIEYGAYKNKAMSHACSFSSNYMSSSTLNSITTKQYAEIFSNTDPRCNISISMITASEQTIPSVSKIVINNKEYWLSKEYDLEDYDGSITESDVRWNVKDYGQNYSDFMKVFVMITGDSLWTECTNAMPIPGITTGMNTVGKKMKFKVEWDKSINLDLEFHKTLLDITIN